MTKHLGSIAAAIVMFALPAAAQSVGQGSDSVSGSRISRPPPPPAQMSPAVAAQTAKSRIEADKQAGKTPDRNTLQILLSAQASLKDEEGMEATLEEVVADYNDPTDWVQLIDMTFAAPEMRDQDVIWLGRLLFSVGAPVSPNDASTVGAIASQHGFFGDAVNAKAHGGSVDPDPVPRADEDKKTIQQQIASEQAQDGAYNAKLAEALYGYGMYPEAEAAANIAVQKGDNPDASEPAMVLGQALAAQGKSDAAIAAFRQVKGSPATLRVSRLWVAHVNGKKNGPAR